MGLGNGWFVTNLCNTMIDAHAHIHDHKFDADRDEMVARAFDVGLEAIINIGTSIHESQLAVETAKQYSKKGFPMYATVGLHPHVFNGGREREHEWMNGIGADSEEDVRLDALTKAVEELEKIVAENPHTVKAIGEIGLDYFLPGEEEVSVQQKHWQQTGFVAQVALAKKLELPVVVHGRPSVVEQSDAYHDIAEIVAENPDVSFVMHCYQGNVVVTQKLLALGNVHFSFTGNVTYSKTDDDIMSQVLRLLPVEKMMIETDCPYLTPVPHRGKRNEPAFVQHVAAHIADIKGLSVGAFTKHTTHNTKTFFGI